MSLAEEAVDCTVVEVVVVAGGDLWGVWESKIECWWSSSWCCSCCTGLWEFMRLVFLC